MGLVQLVKRVLVLVALLTAIGIPQSAAAADLSPSARVGASYFDGWSGPLWSFHFGGLIGTEFSGRRPLYGWQDDKLETMRTQLNEARRIVLCQALASAQHVSGERSREPSLPTNLRRRDI